MFMMELWKILVHGNKCVDENEHNLNRQSE
ncbi:hypothetical protein Hjap01_02943 [Haloarcula japonica]